MIKKILSKFFHFHDWGRWKQGEVQGHYRWNPSCKVNIPVQFRVCNTCDLQQVRRLDDE
jgi:hypothetical protein